MTPIFIAQRIRAWRLRGPIDPTAAILIGGASAIVGAVYALILAAVYSAVTWSLPDPWAVARLAAVLFVGLVFVLADAGITADPQADDTPAKAG